MKKGDIIFGKKHSDAIHPIVFLNKKDINYFIGAMLTTSNNFKDNILMKAEHFKVKDENGTNYELQFKNTYLVRAKLLKRNEWKPFRKIGELTEKGIEFIESQIKTEYEKLWEDYIKDN